MNSKVEDFYGKAKNWHEEMQALREIVLDCGFIEAFKWRVPCYTYKNNNVVIIHGFKGYCALNFFKGALLQDAKGILIQQTENSQSARQIRVTSVKEISKLKATIKAYLFEAIEIEKAGLKIEYKKVDDFEVPEEFQKILDKKPVVKKAFEALTPGRQKGYLLHFAGAKQSKTRETRIEACMPRILKGIGFNDCICGHSKRMPSCDGSHKYL